MEEQLQGLGLDYKRVPAVDGRKLSQGVLDAIHDKDAEQRYWRSREFDLRKYPPFHELSRAEIACVLSHRQIYQEIVENNIDTVLVLEDDVYLSEQIGELLRLPHLFPHGWDIVELGCCARKTFLKKIKTPQAISGFGELKKAVGMREVIGSYGYIVNFKSANKLLDSTKVIYKTIDLYIGDHKIFNVYVFEPQLVLHNNLFDTTIQTEKDIQKKSKEKAEYNIWETYFPWFSNFPRLLGWMVKFRLMRAIMKLKISISYRIAKLMFFTRQAFTSRDQ